MTCCIHRCHCLDSFDLWSTSVQRHLATESSATVRCTVALAWDIHRQAPAGETCCLATTQITTQVSEYCERLHRTSTAMWAWAHKDNSNKLRGCRMRPTRGRGIIRVAAMWYWLSAVSVNSWVSDEVMNFHKSCIRFFTPPPAPALAAASSYTHGHRLYELSDMPHYNTRLSVSCISITISIMSTLTTPACRLPYNTYVCWRIKEQFIGNTCRLSSDTTHAFSQEWRYCISDAALVICNAVSWQVGTTDTTVEFSTATYYSRRQMLM